MQQRGGCAFREKGELPERYDPSSGADFDVLANLFSRPEIAVVPDPHHSLISMPLSAHQSFNAALVRSSSYLYQTSSRP